MKYQEPKLELLLLTMETIVHTSITDENWGDGPGIGGDGTQPWE